VGWLLSIYIAATVFGVGVTTIDLLGLIGDHGSEGTEGDTGGEDGGDASDSDGGDDFGTDDGDFADDADGDFADDSDGDFAEDADEGGEDADDTGGRASIAGHDRRRRNPVLRLLSMLRNVVYFALGFGPTGWFALGTGQGVTASLAWGGGVGVVVLVGTRLLRRVLRSELSSEIKESDLLMERGTVTVTVGPRQLGRVRIRIGSALVDRYARSTSDAPLSPGTPVRVVDIADDCIYVESEEG
jgi:membrane protein implicated in regulation of membrane protease activity